MSLRQEIFACLSLSFTALYWCDQWVYHFTMLIDFFFFTDFFKRPKHFGKSVQCSQLNADCCYTFSLLLYVCLSVSPLLQCEDGAAVDGRGCLQDHLLCDERKPGSVLGLRVSADPNRRGHLAAGPFLQSRHTGQARLNMAAAQVCSFKHCAF